jgi:hypothetical protein
VNCSKFESRLTDYMDQTVDPRLQEFMTEHLVQCRECTQLLGEVELLRRSLTDFPEIPFPPELVLKILDRTSGRPRSRSLWRDMVQPTVRPFLTQRYAFGTGILLVFMSLAISMLSPAFSTFGYSDFTPSGVVENADRLSDQVKKRWARVKVYETQLVQELKLIKEDIYGRLDYHLINLLFKSYSESVQQEEQKNQTEPSEEQ